jgi:ATP-dependent DNA helicase RecQ
MSAAAPQLDAFLPRFGLTEFRQGQRDVIEAVLAGQDCLCVMPTGGGKSLCYQLPSIAREGFTLVVSPLIALMQDQVRALEALGLRATFINSTLDPAEQNARLDAMAAGRYDLIYVAAERFRSARFLEAVQAARLQLLAIDEAHCISEWGHDFRPDYARLGRYRARLGRPPTIALTATATDAVRRDIIEQLDLRQPRVFITGFARPNLHYEVQTPGGQKAKDEAVLNFLAQNPGPGIIYASTRKRCEEVAATIASGTKLRVGVYHAGLLNDERRTTQEAFMRGDVPIVVATNAFGMGIDKSDVRFVLHYNLPGTLEAYYQEAGRAGRDGKPSHCLLLYSTGDRFIQEFFIDSAYPPREVVARVYQFLCENDADPIELTQQEIKETLGLNIGSDGVGTCEQLLEKAGVLERLEARQNMAVVRIDSDLPTLVDLLPRQATTQRRVLQAVEALIGPRRNELVYFRPHDLLDRTGLDQTSLSRALRELKQLQSFDYVPPFRGRAIHMLDRTKPFEELDIDFETLEKRKDEEYLKLERVIAFARTNGCRQQTILSYFGQAGSGACGHCDNCAGRAPRREAAGGAAAASHPAVIEAVRKALSGVARGRSRFGKHVIAQMLCGSRSEKIKRLKLDALSTYGLLAELRQEEVLSLLEALLAARLIEQMEVGHQRPVLQLTDRGTLVMRGQASTEGVLLPAELVERLSRKSPPARGGQVAPQPAPEREKPATRADAMASVVPKPTPAAARAAPATHEHHRNGQSPTRQDNPMSGAMEPPQDAAPGSPPAAAPSLPSTPEQPNHYWTWRLLDAGFTPAECATIRGVEEDVVLDHALRAVEAGWRVRAEWFLTPELTEALQQVIGPADPARIRPLLSQLPVGTRYNQVQWFLACRRVCDTLVSGG